MSPSSSDPRLDVPDGLWPELPPLVVREPAFQASEFPVPIEEIAEMIARTIHLEMHGTGQADAQAEAAAGSIDSRPTARELTFYARTRADNAARILAFYKTIHDHIPDEGQSAVATPQELKEAATESYLQGLQTERDLRAQGVHRAIPLIEFDADPASFGMLPPAPENLWRDENRFRRESIPLSEDDFGMPLQEIAGLLARSVTLEMAGAGACAAKTEASAEESRIPQAGLRFHVHARTASASRHLALYGVVYRETASGKRARLPNPERLKEIATLSYRTGLRDGLIAEERDRLLHPDHAAFNDALYEELRRKPPGQGPKFNR